jgi:hypothetical protein
MQRSSTPEEGKGTPLTNWWNGEVSELIHHVLSLLKVQGENKARHLRTKNEHRRDAATLGERHENTDMVPRCHKKKADVMP